MTDPSTHVRRMIGWFTTGTIVAAAVALSTGGPVVGPPWVVGVLALGFLAAEVAATRVRHGAESEGFAITEVPLALGLLVLGPVGLLVARLVGGAAAMVGDRRARGDKLWFNLTMWTCQDMVAIAIVLGLAGDDRISVRGAYALLLAIVITDAMAAVAVDGVIARVRGAPHEPGALLATIKAGLPPALAAAAFAFVLVRTVHGDWMLGGPLALIGLSIWRAFRAESSLLTEQDGLRRIATLGSVVLDPDLDEDASVVQLLAAVGELLDADVIGLHLVEPSGRCAVFATDARADALLDRLGHRARPCVLTAAELDGAVRDGLTVPLPPDAPVTGTLLVADSTHNAGQLGPADLRVAASLAGQLATMVHNARLHGTVREQATQARWEARHDPLTQLPNRLWLDEHLTAQPRHRPYSLLLMDLDGFKAVNDALGHTSGDALLVDFARRLREILPPDVIATRFAGDEFVCVVPGPVERGHEIAVSTRAHFQVASDVRGVRLSVLPSIGQAHHPTDCTDPGDLLRAADVAMFRAKHDDAGIARFVVMDAEGAARKLRLGVDLREAIQAQRITCAFQPVIGLRDGTVSHFEALARWHHPDLGPVSPDEFIVLAEQGGLIRDLTLHMTRQAARACKRWLTAGLEAGVAVNLSPHSLTDASMPGAIAAILRDVGLDPRWLSVEITETTLLTDPSRALPLLAEFEASGIGVAIDDFGTGYSSLAYLGRIPVDVLKIDRSLLVNRDDARGDTILRAVIDLAASLGLAVVAEGIESHEDYLWLRDLDCTMGQGFFMGQPMPEDSLPDWWSSWRRTRTELSGASQRLSVASTR